MYHVNLYSNIFLTTAPVMNLSISKIEVKSNEGLTVTCEVDPAQEEIKWKYGDETISSGTTANLVLTLADLTKKQTGIYKCITTTDGVSTTRELNLEVLSPAITFIPERSEVKIDGSIKLQCSVQNASSGKLEIRRVDGQNLRGLGGCCNLTREGSKLILTVLPAKEKNQQLFKFKCFTKDQSQFFKEATVRVKEVPMNLEPGQHEYVLDSNSKLDVTCKVSSESEYTLSWSPIGGQHSVQLDRNTAKLSMQKLTTQDKNTYTCTAEGAGLTFQENFTLSVHTPKLFVRDQRTKYKFQSGEKIAIDCTVQFATADINMYWKRKDGKEFKSTLYTNKDGRKITLFTDTAIPDMSGEYQCMLDERFKAKAKEIEITVKDPDLLIEQQKTISGVRKMSSDVDLEISCSLSVPQETVSDYKLEWKFVPKDSKTAQMLPKGLQQVTSDSGKHITHHLKIPRTRPAFSGTYICTAETNLYTIENDFSIQVAEPKIKLVPTKKELAYQESGDIDCTVSGAKVDSLRWYYQVKGGALPANVRYVIYEKKAQLQIVDGTPEMGGTYICDLIDFESDHSKQAKVDIASSKLPMIIGISLTLFFLLIIAIILYWQFRFKRDLDEATEQIRTRVATMRRATLMAANKALEDTTAEGSNAETEAKSPANQSAADGKNSI